jgi:hypothetical protein
MIVYVSGNLFVSLNCACVFCGSPLTLCSVLCISSLSNHTQKLGCIALIPILRTLVKFCNFSQPVRYLSYVCGNVLILCVNINNAAY